MRILANSRERIRIVLKQRATAQYSPEDTDSMLDSIKTMRIELEALEWGLKRKNSRTTRNIALMNIQNELESLKRLHNN